MVVTVGRRPQGSAAAESVVFEGLLRSVRAATISAWTAHALAWAAGVWLTFGPAYEGMSVTPALPGEEPSGGAVRFTTTLVEVNGLYVLLWLLLPVLVTGIGLLAIHLANNSYARHRTILWCAVVALLGFCAVGVFSIGVFYLPAALALFFAAVTDHKGEAQTA